MDKHNSRAESGYITVEYALVTAVVVVALLAPLPIPSGDSMTDIIMGSIKEFQSHTTTMLALP